MFPIQQMIRILQTMTPSINRWKKTTNIYREKKLEWHGGIDAINLYILSIVSKSIANIFIVNTRHGQFLFPKDNNHQFVVWMTLEITKLLDSSRIRIRNGLLKQQLSDVVLWRKKKHRQKMNWNWCSFAARIICFITFTLNVIYKCSKSIYTVHRVKWSNMCNFLGIEFICFSLTLPLYSFISFLIHYQGLKINLYTFTFSHTLYAVCNWQKLICLTIWLIFAIVVLKCLSMCLANHA